MLGSLFIVLPCIAGVAWVFAALMATSGVKRRRTGCRTDAEPEVEPETCWNCGYAVGGLGACPECGSPAGAPPAPELPLTCRAEMVSTVAHLALFGLPFAALFVSGWHNLMGSAELLGYALFFAIIAVLSSALYLAIRVRRSPRHAMLFRGPPVAITVASFTVIVFFEPLDPAQTVVAVSATALPALNAGYMIFIRMLVGPSPRRTIQRSMPVAIGPRASDMIARLGLSAGPSAGPSAGLSPVLRGGEKSPEDSQAASP